MAFISNTPSVVRRKSFLDLSPDTADVDASEPRSPVTPGVLRSMTRHLTIDQYVSLIARIEDEGGVATLEDIAQALPSVQRPISAVFDLCDAGILGADLDACLDGNMRIWRIDG